MELWQKQKKFMEYLVVACIVSAANVLFGSNYMLSLMVVVLEIVWLILLFVQGKIADYLCYFMFFMCNCMEYAAFTGNETIYCFKNFRIAGINIGIFMLLPVFFWGLGYYRQLLIIRRGSIASKFCYGLLGINAIAMLIGVILILLNDNNINSLGNIAYQFIQEAYSMVYMPLAMMIGIAVLSRKKGGALTKINLGLQATLWANVFQMIVSLVSGIGGTYGYLTTMQVSILNFLIPFMILMYFYKGEVMYPKMTLIIGFIGSILALMYNANGKLIIMFVICLIVYWYFSIRDGAGIDKMISIVSIIVVVALAGTLVAFLSQNVLFMAKFEDAKALLNIFSADWLENLPQSPRVRVEEFRDVFIEYAKKPWLILTGKGYLGSVKDHTGYFYSHLVSADGFVSEAEWKYGIFYQLHEIVSYILIYGFMGIIFLVKYAFKCIHLFLKNHNIWVGIGIYWFVMFYGYSLTLGTFGCVALLYGLFSSEANENKIVVHGRNKE